MTPNEPLRDDPARLSTLLEKAELVIFDFDGVIADSEVISLATLRDALAEISVNLSLAEVRQRFLGTSLSTVLRHIRQEGNATAAEGFAARWQKALFARFDAELEPVPGVETFLDALAARGLRHCIASSGSKERIRTALNAMELTHRFPDVFSAEDVENGKPAPDLFLLASRSMGVEPDRCLVIEDAPFGVRAAQAAGMACAGFVGGAHLTDCAVDHGRVLAREGAALIIPSFDALA